jgi:hypothetical protein
VGEGGRVDDDPGGFGPRRVDPVDDLVLGVRLVEADLEPDLGPEPPAVGLDVGERLAPVDLGLALAEQVQVRSVQDIDDAGQRCLQLGCGSRLDSTSAGGARPTPRQ